MNENQEQAEASNFNPVTMAVLFLQKYVKDGMPRLMHWQGEYRKWSKGAWRPAEEAGLKASIQHFLISSGKSSRKHVEDVLYAVRNLTHLAADTAPGSTIGYDTKKCAFTVTEPCPTDPDQISLTDGVLEWSGSGQGLVRAASPALFVLNALPISYFSLPGQGGQGKCLIVGTHEKTVQEEAIKRGDDFSALTLTTPQWDAWLADRFPDDQQSIDLLQEIFGYVLSGRTDLQKAFFLYGPSRSGKGTIARILTSLVGPDGCTSPAVSDLSKDFGLESMISKSLSITGDATFSGRDVDVLVGRLKQISGEDTISVQRKFKTAWEGKLNVRFMFLTNELPALPDASGAVSSRFEIVRFRKHWQGHENPTVEAALMQELAGILLWGLAGYDRLVANNGQFTQPEAARSSKEVLGDTSAPQKTFITEYCDVDSEYTVSKDEFREVYNAYRRSQGAKEADQSRLGRALHVLGYEGARLRDPGSSTGRTQVYMGLRLKHGVEVTYDGKFQINSNAAEAA
jgi:P4 family phage/plasmid primase-like protien